MITKKPEERFGLIAVDKGFLALEKLIEAMKIQPIGDVQRFKYRLIGEILLTRQLNSRTMLHKRFLDA